MNNLTKKTLWQSTTFQFGLLIILFAAPVYAAGGITGGEFTTVLMTVFGAYTVKEVGAKGAEAYRDKGA